MIDCLYGGAQDKRTWHNERVSLMMTRLLERVIDINNDAVMILEQPTSVAARSP